MTYNLFYTVNCKHDTEIGEEVSSDLSVQEVLDYIGKAITSPNWEATSFVFTVVQKP